MAACAFKMPISSVVGQGGPGTGEEVPELLLVPPLQGCRSGWCLGEGTAPKSSPALKQQFGFAAEFQLFQANFPERSGRDPARLLDRVAATPGSECSPTHEAVAVLLCGGILLSQCGCPGVPSRIWGNNILPHPCRQQPPGLLPPLLLSLGNPRSYMEHHGCISRSAG